MYVFFSFDFLGRSKLIYFVNDVINRAIGPKNIYSKDVALFQINAKMRGYV